MPIAANDLRLHLRNRTLLLLAVMLFALMAGGIWTGLERAKANARERTAAAAADRSTWDAQGERNPHSAAHFSRYAFKSTSPLAFFDPGVLDHAGLAVGMEAHDSNPATIRRAEEAGDLSDLAALSPAWILQSAAPLALFVILFGSIAGERENGTLRQMLSAGVSPRRIRYGKIAGGAIAVALAISPAALLAAAGGMHVDAGPWPSDAQFRVLALVVLYAIYFLGLAAFALGVSAMSVTRRQALILLLGAWALGVAIAPRIAASLAAALHPAPTAVEFASTLSAASGLYWNDEEMQARKKEELLSAYGVTDVSDLPFSYEAWQLNLSEEISHPAFDEAYRDLDSIFRRQERAASLLSIFSPTMAVSRLSAAFSGTDRLHHKAFQESAETHRRLIVKQLNDDMLNNAGAAGYSYVADDALWKSVPDFTQASPAFIAIINAHLGEISALLIFTFGAFVFCAVAVDRAQRLEAGK